MSDIATLVALGSAAAGVVAAVAAALGSLAGKRIRATTHDSLNDAIAELLRSTPDRDVSSALLSRDRLEVALVAAATQDERRAAALLESLERAHQETRKLLEQLRHDEGLTKSLLRSLDDRQRESDRLLEKMSEALKRIEATTPSSESIKPALPGDA